MASPASTENKDDEGHLHVTIDGRPAGTTGDAEQVIPPGDHELEVEYVANDHAPLLQTRE